MRIKAKFFAHFRDLFGGRVKEIDLGERRTVADALDLLCDTPERRAEVFAASGLKPHLVVMVNGVHINSLKGLDTVLAEGDMLAVFPFLVGG
ncbi:MAG TPA: ubiquitin-like small modifier protein 1 [Burkholderiales bacterium]|nr:ubiquitin-like small modifier protein 1 [Burkholderiales bacterium]